MKKINESKNNMAFIKKLYNENKINLEETTIIGDNLKYIISYYSKDKYYHVYIQENDNVVVDLSFEKLSPSTLKYFNMIEGDIYNDAFSNHLVCKSHIIEYE